MPMPPTGRDRYVAPIACAASSTTATPAREAAATIGSRLALRPNRCTGRTAFVREVTAAAMPAASMLKVSGSMSTKMGRAPTRTMAPAVGSAHLRRPFASWHCDPAARQTVAGAPGRDKRLPLDDLRELTFQDCYRILRSAAGDLLASLNDDAVWQGCDREGRALLQGVFPNDPSRLHKNARSFCQGVALTFSGHAARMNMSVDAIVGTLAARRRHPFDIWATRRALSTRRLRPHKGRL